MRSGSTPTQESVSPVKIFGCWCSVSKEKPQEAAAAAAAVLMVVVMCAW